MGAQSHILHLWLLSSFFVFLSFFFFSRLISAVADWMSNILSSFYMWCGLSANLECRCEIAARGSLEYSLQDAKITHKSASGQHRTIFYGCIKQLVSTIGKKFHNIYIFRGCCLWQNFATCNIHYTHKSSYIGSVTARHFSSGRQPNFAAWCKEWNYGTFAQGATYRPIRLGGHHVGHRPAL